MLRSSSSRLFKSLPSPSTSAVRTYATAKNSSAAGSRKKANQQVNRGTRPGEGAGDSRVEAIKNVLYESSPSDSDRLAALQKVVPSREVHETIERAWKLHQRHRRETHSRELERKYTSMRQAIDLLEQTDKTLWEKAVGGKKFQNVDQSEASNARLEGIVPRELRVPMEQPGGQLWDSDWKAPAGTPSKKA
ncbi:mitochondrial 54S ribosomal protein mL40 MRPL28 [Sporobolomyces salmoneus]|uniref:mitochondrial 54S ribosomal protein mL40 MRPL28 n=1 Tax=Sporobolomyces salmoneus TaxID=183962 RepID=UPI0031739DC0